MAMKWKSTVNRHLCELTGTKSAHDFRILSGMPSRLQPLGGQPRYGVPALAGLALELETSLSVFFEPLATQGTRRTVATFVAYENLD